MHRSTSDLEFGIRSGAWRGFYLDPRDPGQHGMALTLTFHQGRVLGDGLDDVGAFTIEGRYTVESRECTWSKRYDGHEVVYRGFAEDGSIWGVWSIRGTDLRGGFQVRPVNAAEPAQASVTAHHDIATT